tara:strand:- start:60344 stop:61042 length:699 start_codon:yes stop_codon:yes gene_type:complete
MSRFLFLIIFFAYFQGFSQFGVSTPLFKGKDAELLQHKWYAQMQFFLPYEIPIKHKDNILTFVSIQPSIKWQWYNFKKNLVVYRDNNKTVFQEDADLSHIYRDKCLKATSMMQTTSLYMPVELLLWTKKVDYLFFAPGFYVEYITGGKFKSRYSENGISHFIKKDFKKDPGFYGFKRFQYGVCGQIRYKFITVYGIISLTPLFKPNQGVDIRKYNLGILLNFFWKSHSIKPY